MKKLLRTLPEKFSHFFERDAFLIKFFPDRPDPAEIFLHDPATTKNPFATS
jgi:hypothetical protein